VDTEPNVTTQDRRAMRRRPLKKGVTLTVRKGTMGLGPNLSVGGVELSHDGIRVRIKDELKRGDEVELGLTGIGCSKPRTLIAEVRWCRAEESDDGSVVFFLGAKFRRRLLHGDMGLYV
jgi:PilZ domain